MECSFFVAVKLFDCDTKLKLNKEKPDGIYLQREVWMRIIQEGSEVIISGLLTLAQQDLCCTRKTNCIGPRKQKKGFSINSSVSLSLLFGKGCSLSSQISYRVICFENGHRWHWKPQQRLLPIKKRINAELFI